MEVCEGLLNRLAAFGDTDEGETSRCALELEQEARHMQARQPLLSEECLVSCTELLESSKPASPVTRAVIMLLANLSLKDENRWLAVRFGVPGMCVVLLQQYAALPSATLYYLFDLMSTLASADAQARASMRPSIPYILGALAHDAGSLDVLLGGTVTVNTLVMLDATNCELLVSRGGIQVLVNVYRNATRFKRDLVQTNNTTRRRAASARALTKLQANLLAQESEERAQLCAQIQKWARDTLRRVCQVVSAAVDESLGATDFGKYGELIEVDELKWALTVERKTHKSNQSV